MLTRRGVGLLAGSAGAWLAGRALGIPELFIVAAAGAAAVALAAAGTRLTTASFLLRRSVSGTRIDADGAAEVDLTLRNDIRLPASLLLIEDSCPYLLAAPPRFVVPGIAPGQQVTLRYVIEGRSRGRYRIGPLRIRARDPLGLTEWVRQSTDGVEVVVYPRIEPLSDGRNPQSDHGSGASEARRLFTSGDEFHTMREYVSGDDLRQVHWPSTAHRGTLMIRQQELPWQPQATLLCDARAHAHEGAGPTSSLERAISATASLVCHLTDAQYRVRLLTDADRQPAVVQPRATLLDRLAELEASRSDALVPALEQLRAGGQGLLLAVLGPRSASAAQRGALSRHPEVQALISGGRRFRVRIALIVDPSAHLRRDRADGRRLTEAAELAGILSASGWRATTLAPGQSVADAWRSVTDPSAMAQARSVQHAALRPAAGTPAGGGI
ncbi:MAG TPA: DUF58 domain-containing protein [Egibacteraceae bacterium]|nr:DUF58 domain-containing protein [Egibacteraceae bacterium]